MFKLDALLMCLRNVIGIKILTHRCLFIPPVFLVLKSTLITHTIIPSYLKGTKCD